MTKTFWTYAVDGSGVALRTEVAVLGVLKNIARIEIAKPTAEVAQVLKFAKAPQATDIAWATDGTGSVSATVNVAALDAAQFPTVELFNWLD